MRALWKKIAAIGFLMFLVLWIGGTIRGAMLIHPQPAAPPLTLREDSSLRLMQSNNLRHLGLAHTPLPLVLDKADIEVIKVYEKSAHLVTGTTTFDDDEALIRSAITEYQAIITNEKNGGIAPDRQLTLEIGVHPDQFDALVEKFKQFGRLDSVSVQQRDRTGEFRRLHAQRQSSKKYLESVLKLRAAKNPSIDDTLKLEQKIQEIEKELQAQGVQLGELLGKESFYNIHLTLFEYEPGSRLDRAFTLPQRLAHSSLWALAWWSTAAVALTVLTGTCLSIWTLWPKNSAVAVE